MRLVGCVFQDRERPFLPVFSDVFDLKIAYDKSGYRTLFSLHFRSPMYRYSLHRGAPQFLSLDASFHVRNWPSKDTVG